MVLHASLFALHVGAQSITVKGNVKDNTGEPVIGATVKVLGSTTGVITDVDGNYTIECQSNSKLEFSYIGSKTQVVEVGNRQTVDVTLTEESTAIDEVVVTALGIKRQSRSLGYSTTKWEAMSSSSFVTPTWAMPSRVKWPE